ncbi:hypothetical protein HLB44_30990 [Aquincola sp. S2]|uniref:Uncharacterized protein n=1 Tax=Pseudaquabacterium terrae TaxID=2732868 RepID=A0ABX2ES18_9BURK|nr:hypothetical protein [Aquabacterium terrae]NRF71421.1 hypothetical protein [Aquabacterium terrae]
MDSERSAITSEELKHFLSGYARYEALGPLVELVGGVAGTPCPWREAAAQEIARRVATLTRGFSLPLLVDLVTGAVDPREAARSLHGNRDG